jgi:enamine deaminase RidA (YjgF/YER057c/UK114 family)
VVSENNVCAHRSSRVEPPTEGNSVPSAVTTIALPCFLTTTEDLAVPKQFFNPPALNPTNGFTHVVTTTGGKTIFVSGQVSVNAKAEVVGKGDFRAQVEHTFENLKACLAAAGATFKDVVKITYFVVDLKPDLVGHVREVRKKYLDPDHPPASTLVGVAALVVPDWLIEIEVIAVVE